MTLVLILAGIAFVVRLLKRMGQISVAAAAEHLKHGALVIDVRSPAEFSSAHLRQAINMPLPEIEQLIPDQVKDRNQVLLLHCQSGARSGEAKKKLAAVGYTQAYNLGSYDRASRIVGGV